MTEQEIEVANQKAAIELLNRSEGFDPPTLMDPKYWSDWKLKHAIDAIAKVRAEGRDVGLEEAACAIHPEGVNASVSINAIRSLKTPEEG